MGEAENADHGNLQWRGRTGARIQAKDYAKAEQYLRAAVEADPANLLECLRSGARLPGAGAAEKDVDGLFFIARAANLAQGAGKDQIAKFGKSKYTKYHGTRRGMERFAGEGGYRATASGRFHDHTVRAADSRRAVCRAW